MALSENPVAARLEADRRALLDLTLRNPLLNHKARARSLEVLGESPELLVACLVREGRRMAFRPAAAEDDAPADRTDRVLRTGLTPGDLRATLLAVSYAARSSVQEQGVNTLFLAAGMLRWSEPGHAGTPLRAPLLLVPVELERSTARETFRLRHSGGDLETNLSLGEKLRVGFGVTLPEPPEPTGADVSRYLDAVDAAVDGRDGWSVDRGAAVLGFFSFGKFLMYRDLDPDLWPGHARPEAHPVVKALLHDGFDAEAADDDEDVDLDAVAPPESSGHVVDADGTQAAALWDAARGRNLVIQGPPGTGKSQTITNLIAAAVGAGKTVLFVAEKLAALEVVKRRLDAAGLGDAALELHSHKTSRRAVLDELGRTYALGKPKPAPADGDDRARLAETRARLDGYTGAVHSAVGAGGVTPYEAVGRSLEPGGRHADGPAPPVTPDLSGVTAWTPVERSRRLALVAELQACLAGLGEPGAHPFRGGTRASWPPTETRRLKQRAEAAVRGTTRLTEAAAAMARLLRLTGPADRAGCAALLLAAARAGKAGQLQGVDVASGDWVARGADVRELLGAGATLAALHAEHDFRLTPEAWGADLEEARRTLNVDGRHVWRRLSGAYKRAERQVDGLCAGTPPRTLDERLALADAVLAARRNRETIRRHEPLAARLFGPRWQGEKSSWENLRALADWAARLHHDVRTGKLPGGLPRVLADGPPPAGLKPAAEALKAAMAVHRDDANALENLLGFDGGDAGPLPLRPFADQERLYRSWAERAGEMPAMAAYNRLAGRCRDEGLGGIVALAEVWPEAASELTAAVERMADDEVVRRAFAERPALAEFDAAGHEQALAAFADLDRRVQVHNRTAVALAHWGRIPRRQAGGQVGVLRREFEKRARHLPVRQLLDRAGRAVQAIKPVFLMSPMSVAAYLAPGGLSFDLVVFDEASQVRPVEALGAVLRGKQAVVVGDSKQLPPTNFFDRLTGGGDDDLVDDGPGAGDSSEVESVLGLFVAAGARQRVLRWHYRSRHESLIAVANREFYGGKLAVFPSPDGRRSDTGLTLRHLPGAAYDRGGTRTNPVEAEAVALAVIGHARAQLERPRPPRLTLGVAAFSAAQAGAILDRLERLREDEPGVEPFFDPDAPEPFFVKNLENVQGDERDVIFLSVGYGRTAGGIVTLGFGPLNGDGGERRLNVLITRARLRCEVFTNLRGADIDPARARSRGVLALKAFLDAAERVGRDPDAGTGGNDGLSRAVIEAARGAGLEARGGVGAEGLAPDLAVGDPDRPGRELLGILTDRRAAGPARDRERLRAQVLEATGWTLHRVWSTDWARDPDGALRRLLAAAEAAKGKTPGDDPAAADGPVGLARDDPADADASEGRAEAYRVAGLNGGLDLATADPSAAAEALAEVVRVEGPVHRDEAGRRVSGGKRVGPKAEAAFQSALARAVAAGAVVERGDFLWPGGLDRPTVRDRAALPPASRKPELVPPEELELATEAAVGTALGMPPGDVAGAVCRLLGFPRVSDEMRARVGRTVSELIERGTLVERGELLVVVEGGEGGTTA